MITTLLSELWIQRLGWTLLHFLWQGTAIAGVYAMLRSRMVHTRSADGRYRLAGAALAAMAIAPPLTFVLIPNAAGPWTISLVECQRLLEGVVALWLAGALGFSIRLFGGWRYTKRLRSTAHRAPVEWQQTLEQIAVRMGGKFSNVSLRVSSMVDVPTVIGWVRPAILTPVEFLAGMPAGYITALLAHELAHIRRRDYLASLVQNIVEAALFYHPAVWWISEQMRIERELCCDDLAVAAGGDVLTYARALAALESRRPARLRPAVAANGGSLVNRIRRLIEPSETTANNLPGAGAAWAMTLLWLVGVGVATVHAAQTPVSTLPSVDLNPGPARMPSSAVKTLERQARKSLLYDPFLSAQVVQPQKPRTVEDAMQSPWMDWLNNDVAYIITDAERKAFLQLNSDEERARFVEQFWLRRDPTPDTIENEYKDEHYRRIAYANERFAAGVPGWKTDRGRVYILFGPPDEIDSFAFGGGGGNGTAPFEDWTYRYLEGTGNNVKIEFVDNERTGEFRMEEKEKEKLRNEAGGSQDVFAAVRAPEARFQDLAAAIGRKGTRNVPSMEVRIDYLRGAGASALANISVQFEQSPVNVFARVTTMDGSVVVTFEDVPQSSGYQHSVPLAPGLYRLNIATQNKVAGTLNQYEATLDVPRFDEDTLAASSLVLADRIQRLPAKSAASLAMFAFGGTEVRPRPGNAFRKEENMGIYLQVYNFRPDEGSEKPVGSIEYEIEKADSSEKAMDFSEDIGKIPNASASQVTIEKMLPLRGFQPGKYALTVTVTDRNGNRTLERRSDFTVSAK